MVHPSIVMVWVSVVLKRTAGEIMAREEVKVISILPHELVMRLMQY